MTNEINRRSFVRNAAAASAGIAASAGAIRAASAASNKISLAILGANSRGTQLINHLTDVEGYEIAYVCDPDDDARAKGVDAVISVGGKKPKALKDFRKALEDPSLDAVLVSTPDHWHTPAALMALEAGKNVYVEKPLSHNPREGEMLVEAAAKHKDLVVSMGSQRRSAPMHQEAIDAIHGGIIGRAYHAKCWYANSRDSIGMGKTVAPPSRLDWDLWQGPAPRTPYRDNLVHYNWHWFWNWGTGEACNNGTHELDVCRWALDVDYPVKVSSIGGRFHHNDDDWQAYDTQICGYEFPENKLITWEGKSCNPFPTLGRSRGCIISGTEGTMALLDDSFVLMDMDNEKVKTIKLDERKTAAGITSEKPVVHHLHNFLSAIRNAKKVNGGIENGHKSVLLCHLGNIAQRSGGAFSCDPSNGHILKNEAAQQLWGREYEPGWMPQT